MHAYALEHALAKYFLAWRPFGGPYDEDVIERFGLSRRAAVGLLLRTTAETTVVGTCIEFQDLTATIAQMRDYLQRLLYGSCSPGGDAGTSSSPGESIGSQ